MTKQLVAFKIDKSFLKRIDEYCRSNETSRSSLIRRSLHHYLGVDDQEMMVLDRRDFHKSTPPKTFEVPTHYVQPTTSTVADINANDLASDLNHLRRYDPAFVSWILSGGQNSEAVKMLVSQRMQQYPRGNIE